VLGLPINMDGSEGPRAQSTRSFARNLAKLTALSIALWDERLSTTAVERELIPANASRATREAVINQHTAAYILQGAVNAKRVLRLVREDNLLSLRAKPFIPPTTDSRHAFRIVPNLTRKLVPTDLDQIWVADITYVRLMEDFVYLAVVLDAFSRKVVG
jgi:transposase InsO family protein